MAIKVYSDRTKQFYNTVEEANRAEFELKEKENLAKIEEERKARVAQSGIKMKTYKMSYTINGTPMTERVCAMTQAQAIETCKAQCSMVGWVPYGLQAEEEVA